MYNTRMSLASRAVRGTAVVLVSSYANMGFGIVYGVIMARLLDPEHFGLFGIGLFFVTLLDVRGKLGLDYAFIHRHPTTDGLIATHWALQMGASLLTLALVVIAATIVPGLGYPTAIAPVVIAMAGTLLVESAGSTARAALEKELVFTRSTAIVTGSLFLSYVAAIALAASGYAYWALVGQVAVNAALEKELVFARSTAIVTGSLFLSYVAAIALAASGYAYWALVGQVAVNAALSSLGFWWAFRRLGRRPSIRFSFDRALARWMLRFGATLALGALATVVLLQFDNFLVGTFVGQAVLGYYLQAYKVAQWPTGLVTHVVSRASLPTYARLQNDPPRLSKAFEMSLWLILTTALPIGLAIFVSAPDFLILLYTEKWLPSATLLRFLVAYSVLRPLLDDTGALFTAIGQPRRATTVLVTQAATLVVCAAPLTLALGATGTAIGVGIAFAVGIVVTYRFVSRVVMLDLARVFIPPFVAAAGSVALYLAFAAGLNLNAIPLLARVIIKAGFAAGAFFAIVLLLQRRMLIERVGYIWRLLRGGAT